MKNIYQKISENKNYKFGNKEFIQTLLNLVNDKKIKKLYKINVLSVKIVFDEEDSLDIEIETSFCTWDIDIVKDSNNTYSIGARISSTAYDEIDELLYNSYDSNCLAETNFEISRDVSVDEFLDELISNLGEEQWSSRFKLLYKVYTTLEKYRESAAEDDIESLFEEMIAAYVK